LNCRQTQELISAYLDQELTGRQMLDMRAHMRLCPACARECRETGEMRRLLRALLPPAPPAEAERRLAERLARPELPAWALLAATLTAPSPTSPPPAAPRGRRLATALGLSCVVILAVAAPFAPPAGDAAVSSGNMATLPPVEMSLSPLSPPVVWSAGAIPALFHASLFGRTARAQRPAVAPADVGAGEAEPLRDVTAVDYEQGDIALADYQASASGAH
jgi:anti-sigma factor RsiW